MNDAKFSWNSRYTTRDGWQCQLTIRSDKSGHEVLDLADKAMTWLTSSGCTPAGYNGKPNGATNGETKQCAIHNVAMKQHTKNGQSWWSHQTEEGSWCRGK